MLTRSGDGVNVFVGCETGLFKGVSINSNQVNSSLNFNSFLKLSGENEIVSTTRSSPSEDSSHQEILVGSRNGKLRVFNVAEMAFTSSASLTTSPDLRLVSVEKFPSSSSSSSGYISAYSDGSLKIWGESDSPSDSQSDSPFDSGSDSLSNSFEMNVIVEEVLSEASKGRRAKTRQDVKDRLGKLTEGRSLQVMKLSSSSSSSVVGFAGKECQLQLLDFEGGGSLIWRAKNVKHDDLQLRVPVWVSDFEFLGGTTTTLASVSREGGFIRLYDTRTQRRPVSQFVYPENEPLNCMSRTRNERQILVGSVRGNLSLYDFRGKTPMVRKYKGSVGSVRSIDTGGGNSDYFAAVGLDRFLRIYNVHDKKIVSKMYLKSRLNRVLLADGFDPFKDRRKNPSNENHGNSLEHNGVGGGDDDDDVEIIEDNREQNEKMWNNMDVISERENNKSKKRSATFEQDMSPAKLLDKLVIISSSKKKKLKRK